MQELEMKDTQAISLEILKYIADACDILNIDYYLMWGTLIGAIRHKGFIPWDDDIDIGVKRRDIPKLFDYIENGKGKSEFYSVYCSTKTDNYYYAVRRVIDTRTVIKGEKRPTKKQRDCGVFVDIYPIEEAGDTFEEAAQFLREQAKLVTLRDFALKDRFESAKTSFIYTLGKIPFYLYAKLRGFHYWDNLLEKKSVERESRDCKFKCVWAGCSCDPQKGIFEKSDFDTKLIVPYEAYAFTIPAGYDDILRKGYGDYMKLPPEKERVGHHEYKAYRL